MQIKAHFLATRTVGTITQSKVRQRILGFLETKGGRILHIEPPSVQIPWVQQLVGSYVAKLSPPMEETLKTRLYGIGLLCCKP